MDLCLLLLILMHYFIIAVVFNFLKCLTYKEDSFLIQLGKIVCIALQVKIKAPFLSWLVYARGQRSNLLEITLKITCSRGMARSQKHQYREGWARKRKNFIVQWESANSSIQPALKRFSHGELCYDQHLLASAKQICDDPKGKCDRRNLKHPVIYPLITCYYLFICSLFS